MEPMHEVLSVCSGPLCAALRLHGDAVEDWFTPQQQLTCLVGTLGIGR